MRTFSKPSVIVLIVILLVLPLMVFLASPDEWREWWILRFHAPTLEKDLGFEARVTTHPFIEGEVFYITGIAPGGIFDQAGVRRGWIPQSHHRRVLEFYGLLQAGRGSVVELEFSDIGGDPQFELTAVTRKVRVRVPKERPN